MNKILLVLAMSLPIWCSCRKPAVDDGKEETTDPITLSLADASATYETKSLYSQLWDVQGKAFLFGHQEDLTFGRYWFNIDGRSDTKDVCGDYPAIYGVDIAVLTDGREDKDGLADIRRRCIKEAYDRGMVVEASWHINNPLTGGDSWDNSSNQVAAEILKEGSATNVKFKTWLDRLAAEALAFRGSDGKLIPILFRPYHEHGHNWSWWGSTCTTQQEYIDLWRFTVKYLRDVKGVHNFIYAISPAMNSAMQYDDFFYRWPGDEWVDFIGIDCYQGINNNVFVNNLKLLSKASADKHKPCGVTETGVEGLPSSNYWTVNILAPLTGRRVSMVITWTNKFVASEDDDHYFSVYKGHKSEKDFVQFYSSENTWFCADLPDMYTMAENVTVK